MTEGWDWPIRLSEKRHPDRTFMMRQISYESTTELEEEKEVNAEDIVLRRCKGLSLNISSAGMLLMMDGAPALNRVFWLQLPTPINAAATPTLSEVRWIRELPFGDLPRPHLVGLKFLF